MDKNTIWAIVLSTAVIGGFIFFQQSDRLFLQCVIDQIPDISAIPKIINVTCLFKNIMCLLQRILFNLKTAFLYHCFHPQDQGAAGFRALRNCMTEIPSL